jgi:hypothetical protein
MAKKSLEFLCKKAIELGAKDSKVINVSTVKARPVQKLYAFFR